VRLDGCLVGVFLFLVSNYKGNYKSILPVSVVGRVLLKCSLLSVSPSSLWQLLVF